MKALVLCLSLLSFSALATDVVDRTIRDIQNQGNSCREIRVTQSAGCKGINFSIRDLIANFLKDKKEVGIGSCTEAHEYNCIGAEGAFNVRLDVHVDKGIGAKTLIKTTIN